MPQNQSPNDAQRNQVRLMIQEVNRLPALPQVLVRVMQVAQDPDAPAADLAAAVACDQSLTAKVLALANSAYYGSQGRVASVLDAIVVLGFNGIRNLVVGQALSNVLGRYPACLDAQAFWLHTVGTAHAAKRLAEEAGRDGDFAFTAGLLHDIGILVLVAALPEPYAAVLHEAANGAVPLDRCEKSRLGVDHGTVGGWLCEKWHFPTRLVAGIRAHHAPQTETGDGAAIAHVVALADGLTKRLRIGLVSDQAEPDPTASLAALGLSAQRLDSVAAESDARRRPIEELVGIFRPGIAAR